MDDLMLGEELSKKSEREIKHAGRFWGLEGSVTTACISTAIGDKKSFAVSLLKLNRPEHALLYNLFTNEGVLIKGELENRFPADVEINEVIKSLAEKLIIYLRKDRGLLTDRHDKIYLFPAIVKALKGFDLMDEGALRGRILKLLQPGCMFVKNTPVALKNLAQAGWVRELTEKTGDGIRALHKKGLIEIILAQRDMSFVPLWTVTDKAAKYIKHTGNHVNYRSCLYFNDMVNITDCLLQTPLKKKYFRKNLGTCVNKITDNSTSADRYLEELYYLNIIREKEDSIRIDTSFASGGFDQKLKILRKKLTDCGKKVLNRVGESSLCSKLFVTSSLMMDNRFEIIFGEGSEEQTGISGVLEDLIFRGFILEGFDGSTVRLNSFEKRAPVKDSAVVNTDFEILVFADRIPLRSLYILAGFSHVIRNAEIIRLKIDRFSVLRGIAYYGGIDIFMDVLTKASKRQLSRNVDAAVKEWSQSYLEVDLKTRLIIRIDSPGEKFRLFHNRYIQSVVEEETEKFLVLKPDADIETLRLELRKQNIYIK